MSSSSQVRSRGQARTRDSWAIVTVSCATVTSRERTSRSSSRGASGEPANTRVGTRVATGSPAGVGVTSRRSTVRRTSRSGGVSESWSRSADWAIAEWIPPVARYPSTVSTVPSRCSQVSARAWESNGNPPGAPATSRTSTSTSPGSSTNPTSRAGSSIAARNSSSVNGVSSSSPRSASRDSSGLPANQPR